MRGPELLSCRRGEILNLRHRWKWLTYRRHAATSLQLHVTTGSKPHSNKCQYSHTCFVQSRLTSQHKLPALSRCIEIYSTMSRRVNEPIKYREVKPYNAIYGINDLSSLALGSMSVGVRCVLHHLRLPVCCYGPMLSGSLLVDLLRTTLRYRPPILCVGNLSYYSDPSFQRPVSLISSRLLDCNIR